MWIFLEVILIDLWRKKLCYGPNYLIFIKLYDFKSRTIIIDRCWTFSFYNIWYISQVIIKELIYYSGSPLIWSPTCMEQKTIGHINGWPTGVFLQENVWPFCQAAKKSSHNNKVTVLPRLAIRQGCTVVKNLSGKIHVVNFCNFCTQTCECTLKEIV